MQKICRVKDFQILWGEDQIFRSKNRQNKTKKKKEENKRGFPLTQILKDFQLAGMGFPNCCGKKPSGLDYQT